LRFKGTGVERNEQGFGHNVLALQRDLGHVHLPFSSQLGLTDGA
jgi:hypothetical protein